MRRSSAVIVPPPGAFISRLCGLPGISLRRSRLCGSWITLTPTGIRWLGWFYGGNLAGAVLGSLLAGFYLLRVLDMAATTYVAAAINAGVALGSWTLARDPGDRGLARGWQRGGFAGSAVSLPNVVDPTHITGAAGRRNLCLRFTRAKIDPMWVIYRVELVGR